MKVGGLCAISNLNYGCKCFVLNINVWVLKFSSDRHQERRFNVGGVVINGKKLRWTPFGAYIKEMKGMCRNHVESLTHALRDCDWVVEVWKKIDMECAYSSRIWVKIWMCSTNLWIYTPYINMNWECVFKLRLRSYCDEPKNLYIVSNCGKMRLTQS